MEFRRSEGARRTVDHVADRDEHGLERVVPTELGEQPDIQRGVHFRFLYITAHPDEMMSPLRPSLKQMASTYGRPDALLFPPLVARHPLKQREVFLRQQRRPLVPLSSSWRQYGRRLRPRSCSERLTSHGIALIRVR